jgi:hypothetical protein
VVGFQGKRVEETSGGWVSREESGRDKWWLGFKGKEWKRQVVVGFQGKRVEETQVSILATLGATSVAREWKRHKCID